MADIVIKALGKSGVNLDVDPLLLEDSELRDAQNLVHETSSARQGGIKNRPGLTTFTSAPLSGPILGGIGMAVAGVARATGAGAGPGTGGTGPGDGGPPGGTGPTATGPAPGPWDPTGPIFNGGRLVITGRNALRSDGSHFGDTWYVAGEDWSGGTALITTGPPGGQPNAMGGNPDVGPQDYASKAACIHDGYLYYFSGITLATGNQRPTVRRTNGFIDEKVVTVPRNANFTGAGSDQTLLEFLSADGYVWFTEMTRRRVGGTGPTRARLFRLDPEAKALVNCPMPTYFDSVVAGSGVVAFPIEYHNGHVYVGSYTDSVTGAANIQPMRVTATGAVEGTFGLAIGAPERNVSTMKSFDGQLFIGGGLPINATGDAFAHLWQFAIDGATGGVSVTSVMTPTGAGASGATGNHFPSMAIFKSQLYASYFNPGNGAAIYKFDGTTWTGSFAVTTGAQLRRYFLFPDKNTLYAMGIASDPGTGAPCYLTTADGVTWTDRSTTFTGATGTQTAFPTFFAFEQS